MIASFYIRLIAFLGLFAIVACNRPSPEKAFDVAVLNTNMLVGFANSGMERELKMPSMKMGSHKDEVVSMKRKEVVEGKINFIEGTYQKLKGFSVSDDNSDIIQTSIQLHELILPVYKKEYMHLAALYDGRAPAEEIQKQEDLIRNTYASKFEKLYNQLISSGKEYAKKHDIKVKWRT